MPVWPQLSDILGNMWELLMIGVPQAFSGTILFPFVVPAVFKPAIWVFPPIFSSTLVQRWRSHHIMFFYITSHCITFTSRYIMSRHITFIYMYLYLIWEQFLFFHTKLIVQAYGQLGHRVQDLAVCSGLTHLIRGSLRGFSPAGQSLTSSEVDKVIA